MSSISQRVYKTFFTFSLLIIIVALAFIIVASEDLERTLLNSELEEEMRFMQTQYSSNEVIYRKTAYLIALYLPDQSLQTIEIPAIFANISPPFHGEVRIKDETFLLRASRENQGRYFIAMNISNFEKREEFFLWSFAAVALLILIFTYFFAKLASKKLTGPLDDLSQRIQSINVGSNVPRLNTNYKDRELQVITRTFNAFLDELENFVIREQSLMSLASHELRTPVAVISGAIEVLYRRATLSADDLKTVTRIQSACNEISANIDMLLVLSRRSDSPKPFENLQVDTILDQALDDLTSRFNLDGRITVHKDAPVSQQGDPVLVKMLLINLIQNALQHSQTQITIQLDSEKIEIIDQGPGLPASIQEKLQQQNKKLRLSQSSGLGLYIVTLICERLKWKLVLENAEQSGTKACIFFVNPVHH